jgi:hypothetical protein
LENEACEILLGMEADIPEKNLLRKALESNACLSLLFCALLILLVLTQPINISVLLYRHGEISV